MCLRKVGTVLLTQCLHIVVNISEPHTPLIHFIINTSILYKYLVRTFRPRKHISSPIPHAQPDPHIYHTHALHIISTKPNLYPTPPATHPPHTQATTHSQTEITSTSQHTFLYLNLVQLTLTKVKNKVRHSICICNDLHASKGVGLLLTFKHSQQCLFEGK